MSSRYTGEVDDETFRLFYGAAWLNLIGTYTGRRRPPVFERLTSPERLADWLAAVGLAPADSPADDDVVAAIELREALYELARAAVDDRGPEAAAVRALNRALRHDTTPSVRVEGDELIGSRPRTATEAVGRIARQAAEHLTGPERARLRGCADPTCAGIYLDDSGRRRWCADATCGVRNRVRAHRERARDDVEPA